MSTDKTQQERYDRGRSEFQVCTHAHGEADLQRAFIMCSKNPGHREFIPVYKFQMDDLPRGFQNTHLMELIQVLSHLTARVSVDYTSEDRPETCPNNSSVPYPFYMQRQTNMTRNGSGWVWNVEKFSQMYYQKTCPCQECRSSANPMDKWAEIVIASAAHVVFDDKEGRHTTCHLFYDRGSTPEVCRGVVTLRGMYRVETNIKEDKCRLIYVTHDMDLADRLENLTKRFVDLQKLLSQIYNSNTEDQMQMKSETIPPRNYTQPKRQTPQRWQSGHAPCLILQSVNLNNDRSRDANFTCERFSSRKSSPEGDKGDFRIGRFSRRDGTKKEANPKTSISDLAKVATDRPQEGNTYPGRLHSRNITLNASPLRNTSHGVEQSLGVTDTQKPLATSQDCRFYMSQTQNDTSKSHSNKVNPRRLRSNTEPCDILQTTIHLKNSPKSLHATADRSQTCASEGSESNTAVGNQSKFKHVHYNLNSRRVSLDQPPTRYPVLIKSKVRNITSENNEYTQATCPLPTVSQLKSMNVETDHSLPIAAGAGQLDSSIAVVDQSSSNNVKVNQLYSTINSANHSYSANIGVNKSESPTASQSETINYINQSGSPTASQSGRTINSNQSGSPTASQSETSNYSINQSDSTITTLQNMGLEEVKEQMSRVTTDQSRTAHRRSRTKNPVSHDSQSKPSQRSQSTGIRSDTPANPTLTIIVSHPHGCNKQITVGYYTERVEVKDSRNLTRYVYTTPTCPGSSGAPVYVLGRWRGWWPCDHPHSGNSEMNKGLNFSGTGLH